VPSCGRGSMPDHGMRSAPCVSGPWQPCPDRDLTSMQARRHSRTLADADRVTVWPRTDGIGVVGFVNSSAIVSPPTGGRPLCGLSFARRSRRGVAIAGVTHLSLLVPRPASFSRLPDRKGDMQGCSVTSYTSPACELFYVTDFSMAGYGSGPTSGVRPSSVNALATARNQHQLPIAAR